MFRPKSRYLYIIILHKNNLCNIMSWSRSQWPALSKA